MRAWSDLRRLPEHAPRCDPVSVTFKVFGDSGRVYCSLARSHLSGKADCSLLMERALNEQVGQGAPVAQGQEPHKTFSALQWSTGTCVMKRSVLSPTRSCF